MKCRFAPRYRVTIKIRDGKTAYGITGRRCDPLTGREVRRDMEDVAGCLEDTRGIVRLLNARCVGLEWMREAVERVRGV